jgi:hypothetical protein
MARSSAGCAKVRAFQDAAQFLRVERFENQIVGSALERVDPQPFVRET